MTTYLPHQTTVEFWIYILIATNMILLILIVELLYSKLQNYNRMPPEAKAAPKQDSTLPKHKPTPLDPAQCLVDPYTAATRARDELCQLSSKAPKLNTDGTITLTPVQMAFFQ
ncbi:uncharacterized protein ALTATR162_LOCUS10443 [Alternaria atra]|uniref:Uncharacterized protein n=1 Tax=Alternaria atra TaxID=119953 RepID=A0A8J2IA23_9PLEO|nr:uncharacterized protein ALTATR162_LOCUS10443 [Alternaria atra]CAG5183115.1 unnamed protein product [Alternaria atra]